MLILVKIKLIIMKKVILAVIALTAFAANAQDGLKGKWFLMGQAGYGTQNDGDITNYSILPAVGYFVAPTTAVGLAIGYAGDSDKTSGTKIEGNQFIVQPLARQYWGLTDNLFFFGQASVPLVFGEVASDKYSSVGVNVGAGLDYFLSSHWSIETQFGFIDWTSVKPDGGNSTSDFNIGVNSGLLGGLKLGVKYVF